MKKKKKASEQLCDWTQFIHPPLCPGVMIILLGFPPGGHTGLDLGMIEFSQE